MTQLLVHGGTVLTRDPDHPSAEALLVEADIVVATGTDDELAALARPGVERVDLDVPYRAGRAAGDNPGPPGAVDRVRPGNELPLRPSVGAAKEERRLGGDAPADRRYAAVIE